MTATISIKALRAATSTGAVSAELHAQLEQVMLKPTRSGGEFLELKLADAEDHCVLRVWSDHPAFAELRGLPAGGTFLSVVGEWSTGTYGLDVKSWTQRPLTDAEKATLLGGPAELRAKQAADYADITRMASALADPRLLALSAAYLEEYGERFRRTGAAREYHHARRGGLVEHVAQMMRTAAAICLAYPYINRDLVLTGVLFHDAGKLWENCYVAEGFAMPYSEHGELLGHITLGIELVNKLWRRISELPEAAAWSALTPTSEDVRLHLLHLIASHHGEYAFGSPVLPRTPEAVVLHHVDNIDAKLEMMATCYATSPLLAKTIYEKKRPLPSHLVSPLTPYPAS